MYTRRDGFHTQVDIGIEEGLKYESSIHCDEFMSLPKSSLTSFIGSLSPAKQALLDRAVAFALGLTSDTFPEGAYPGHEHGPSPEVLRPAGLRNACGYALAVGQFQARTRYDCRRGRKRDTVLTRWPLPRDG